MLLWQNSNDTILIKLQHGVRFNLGPSLMRSNEHSLAFSRQIQSMFTAIAPRYDFLNRLLSVGLDRYWRKKLVSVFNLDKTNKFLDVATGTGDVVFSMYSKFKVNSIGIDIAEKMIKIASIKKQKKHISDEDMIFIRGDAEKLDFQDNTFDALTISFGFRNLGDYELGLSEFYRVLKPGGKLAILEFSKPSISWFSPFFRFYFKRIVPLIGAMLARKDAFLYLFCSLVM